jgi:hypothetical protein
LGTVWINGGEINEIYPEKLIDYNLSALQKLE